MSYGSKKNENGEDVKANGKNPIIVGENVPGNELLSIDFKKDEAGNVNNDMVEMKFRQSNGATFTHTFMNGEEKWMIDKINRETLHIATKVMKENEWYDKVGETENFQQFMNKVIATLVPALKDKKFTLKIVYRISKNGKAYPSFPTYPNFIELDGTTPSTLSTNPKYDIYVKPEQPVSAGGEKEEESAF